MYVIRERREEGFEEFYFNAGGMGHEAVCVKIDDLAEAFRELGFEIE